MSTTENRRNEQAQLRLEVDWENNGIIEGTEPPVESCVGPIHCWECCPENLPNHPTLAFFGKRRTGKSTTITNILFHCCQDIPFGIVMSDTAYAGKPLPLPDL